MVRAWHIDEAVTAIDHQTSKDLTLDELNRLTGVIYYKVDPENYRNRVDEIKLKYEYKREDIVSMGPRIMENFYVREKHFSSEHLHRDEEVRFALDGEGYLDVRDENDKWVRMHIRPGDFLILPESIHHRFFFKKDPETGESLPIKLLRCFKEDIPYHMAFRSEQ